MRSYMRRLSARPHHVGSPYDKANAEWLLAQFKEWGWQAQIETFDVLFPTPRERAVELVTPTRFVAKLQEPSVPGDPTSGQQSEQLPTYNAYSADGDVTGPLVYVNYGVPADYEQLERLGVSVKGAIVIARYGGSWRGIKPKVAAEHGAVGCLIYSDPRDDGYRQGDVYPQGPWRPRDGVQRGSAADLPRYPRDPLTPGAGAAADQWSMRGNHRDAWVNGAQDPISGLVPLPEEARALGQLARQGWKPRRTIIYAAWDGEEPGLLGSTEWVETHGDELRQHGAVYINSDVNSRGYLLAAGSHALQRLVNDVARDIVDPETKLSVWKRAQLREIAEADSAERRREIRQAADLRIDALGSGSDYTPFLQHAGVATLDLRYGGEGGGGIYHSIYDDFRWFTTFDDTSFVYGRALAQTVGTAVLRLANAEVLPFEFGGLAETVGRYVRELKQLLKNQQDQVRERNHQIEEGLFTATADPREPFVPPQPEEVPPYLNFAPLDNAVDTLTKTAQRYEQAFARAQADSGKPLARPEAQALNALLIQSERTLTSAEGLPRRPWFRHQLYAPGFYTGYGVKTMPGVREAIEQKNWKEADDQIGRVAQTLTAEAALLDRATAAAEALAR